MFKLIIHLTKKQQMTPALTQLAIDNSKPPSAGILCSYYVISCWNVIIPIYCEMIILVLRGFYNRPLYLDKDLIPLWEMENLFVFDCELTGWEMRRGRFWDEQLQGGTAQWKP